MASLDFELEKDAFKEFYDTNNNKLELAKDTLVSLINFLTAGSNVAVVSKVEGRVKERDECISKFTRKYRTDLENKAEPYEIKRHITDLIGLRIVCLYEDDVIKIKDLLSSNFSIMSVTDKIVEVEGTEATFGYKGLHVDLRHNNERLRLPEYSIYEDLNFEIQIRTVVQDSWSIIDHKIKYKKSIPNDLKRRINTLAALFELADREFRAIRDATFDEIQKAQISAVEIAEESENYASPINSAPGLMSGTPSVPNYLDAFSFERIARHFFPNQEFEPHKVDGFVQEIVEMNAGITRGTFNRYIRDHISFVKKYRDERQLQMNPFTVMRHCLYTADNTIFGSMLTNFAKSNFESWRNLTLDQVAVS